MNWHGNCSLRKVSVKTIDHMSKMIHPGQY